MKATDDRLNEAVAASAAELDAQRPERNLAATAPLLGMVCLAAWLANMVNGAPLLDALPGMLILYAMAMLGLVIGRLAPFYLPSVAWVSLVSILMTLPVFPGNAWFIERLAAVDFLAVVTPVLAYAGLALTQREFTMFRQTGWKLVIISLLVFTGTFMTSALVAHLILTL